MAKAIPGGVVHKVPSDLRAVLTANADLNVTWADLTPLARPKTKRAGRIEDRPDPFVEDRVAV